MDFVDIIGFVFTVLALIGFQGFATLRVWRSNDYDRAYQVAQTRLIWLLPLIGAVIVLLVLGDANRAKKA